jgi:hypothetical protein
MRWHSFKRCLKNPWSKNYPCGKTVTSPVPEMPQAIKGFYLFLLINYEGNA